MICQFKSLLRYFCVISFLNVQILRIHWRIEWEGGKKFRSCLLRTNFVAWRYSLRKPLMIWSDERRGELSEWGMMRTPACPALTHVVLTLLSKPFTCKCQRTPNLCLYISQELNWRVWSLRLQSVLPPKGPSDLNIISHEWIYQEIIGTYRHTQKFKIVWPCNMNLENIKHLNAKFLCQSNI